MKGEDGEEGDYSLIKLKDIIIQPANMTKKSLSLRHVFLEK